MLSKIFQRAEKYDPVHPRDPGLSKLFGGLFSNTSSGVSVTPENSLSITAVYAAVKIISESVSMLPWSVFNIDGNTRTLANADPRHWLLHRKPNRFQNTIEYRQLMMTYLLLKGRAVSEIIINKSGVVTDLIPLHPDHITVFRAPDGRLAYSHRPPEGKSRVLLQDEVVDVRGISYDGVRCLSPIEANAEALGVGKASEIYAAKYFGNGTVVSGVLETDTEMTDTTYKRLKEWTERHQGVARSHNPAILEGGLKWKSISINPEDAQLLETRSHSVEDVARIFRIPAYKLQRMDSVKFNTTEQQAIDFNTDTLTPNIKTLELAHDMVLFSEKEQRKLVSTISLLDLNGADSKTRVEYYRGMFNMGSMSPNEIRASEGMNPIKDGDKYYIQVNQTTTDSLGGKNDSKE